MRINRRMIVFLTICAIIIAGAIYLYNWRSADAPISNKIDPIVETGITLTADMDTEDLLLQNLPGVVRLMPSFDHMRGTPVPLSENSRVIEAAIGDLNSDGINDLAVVIEHATEHAFGKRRIYVLLGDSNGAYIITHKSEALILEHDMGGVFGEPFENIAIEDNALIIRHYGGSSFRWGYNLSFAYDNNGQFAIAEMTAIESSTHTANGEETICDFRNRRIERYSWSGYDKTRRDFLYSGDLVADAYLFDEATFDEIVAHHTISFLPNLGYYQYDRFDKPLDLYISASHALDMVMTQYYPELEKISIPWTQENRDNYSKLLFYDVQDYFYQGESGLLKYLGFDIRDNNGTQNRQHCISFEPSDGRNTEYHYVIDLRRQQ